MKLGINYCWPHFVYFLPQLLDKPEILKNIEYTG